MSQFEFAPTFILNVLKDKYLTVPRYQRSYSWSDDEVGDFWDDIKSAVNDDREYFFGTIVLSSDAEAGSQAIIDGQQRIATTTILLAVLRNVFNEHGLADPAQGIQNQFLAPYDITAFAARPRLRLNTVDHPFYNNIIIENLDQIASVDSHILLANAKKMLTSNVQALVEKNPDTWKKRISKIIEFLTSNARVIVVKAPTDADAFTIFETLNDRGADLTIADLLKNYLFSSSKEEIEFVQNNWIETVTILNLYQPNRDFVNFLRHLWSSMYGPTRERDLYRKIKEKVKSRDDAIGFSKLLVDGAKYYAALLSGDSEVWKSYSSQTRIYMDVISKFDLEQNRPLLLAVLQFFPRVEVERTIKSLIAWLIRGLVAGSIGGGKAEKYFCEAAIDIRAGKIKTAADLLTKIGPIVPSDAAFSEDFKTFRTTNGALSRYMLLAIERELSGAKEPELVPNDDVESVNLEHILPRNAKQVEWPNFSEDEVGVFAFRLGNMTLLRKSDNNRIGNKSWPVKKTAISKSALKINLPIANEVEWGKTEILNRQIELSGLAIEIWTI